MSGHEKPEAVHVRGSWGGVRQSECREERPICGACFAVVRVRRPDGVTRCKCGLTGDANGLPKAPPGGSGR